MINGSRRGGSAQCCHLVAGGTSLLLLGLLALLNLLLFIGSKCNGDFAAGTDPFSRPEVLSAAELTRLWMLRAADHSGKAKDGTDLYVQTLGFEPFDPSQKVNVRTEHRTLYFVPSLCSPFASFRRGTCIRRTWHVLTLPALETLEMVLHCPESFLLSPVANAYLYK